MKISFFSNFLNHHQLPFCLEMQKKIGNGFSFISTRPISEERLMMGYTDINQQFSFVTRAYESSLNLEKAKRLAVESDVVIIGTSPEKYLIERLKRNRITFRYRERICKKGLWEICAPKRLYSLLKWHTQHRNKNIFLLCAGAYVAGDYAMIGAYKKKCFKWGYFPEAISHNLENLFSRKNTSKTIQILWCGRFLNWKHPEKILLLAKHLLSSGYDFKINVIGTGQLEHQLNSQIEKMNLTQHVSMLGTMSPERVRDYMENANIYLFTSDYNEGWGAVLNESMNSGCAVVASHAIGSVPFLLKHDINGLIYNNDQAEDLFAQVESLIKDQALREKLGRNAYHTIHETWNAKIAAENILLLSKSLLTGNQHAPIENGPCSIAMDIKQWDMLSNCVNSKQI